MINPKNQYIDKDSIEKLEKLGFERITQIGHPHEKLSCGFRSRKTGIHLFPLFEESGDPFLYFDYTGGRLKIESVQHLKDLIKPFK